MEQAFSPWLLMAVGLTTVFLALILIILSGKALIWFVNKYVPEEQVAKVVEKASAVPADVRLAIEKAISQISGGKNRIEKIEKL